MARNGLRDMTGWWIIRTSAISLILIAILFFGTMSLVEGCPRRAQRKQDFLALRHWSVRQLYRVLAKWVEENKVLPSSEKGPDYALYMLKVYSLKTATEPAWGSDPQSGGLGLKAFNITGGEANNGPAAWDDVNMRVVGIDYDYLNEPRQLNRREPLFAVYAEKTPDDANGRWVVFCNGATLWVSRNNALYQKVLGSSWKELHRGEHGPVKQPLGSSAPRASSDIIHRQFISILGAMSDYMREHGDSLPFSERGPEAALYKLKPYVSGADLFDAAFMNLENGTAFWNDEEQKIENADFDYLNDPMTGAELDKQPSKVILASKWGCVANANIRRVVFSQGETGTILRGSQNAEDPLGKTVDDLEVNFTSW